jgi:hypothetical protein
MRRLCPSVSMFHVWNSLMEFDEIWYWKSGKCSFGTYFCAIDERLLMLDTQELLDKNCIIYGTENLQCSKWYSHAYGRAVFSHDIRNLSLQKMPEFLRHEKCSYHTEVHFWITRSSHCGKETISRNVCKCCTFHYNNILFYFRSLQTFMEKITFH